MPKSLITFAREAAAILVARHDRRAVHVAQARVDALLASGDYGMALEADRVRRAVEALQDN